MKNKKFLIAGIIFVIITAVYSISAISQDSDVCAIPRADGVLSCTVKKVVDGDTIHAMCDGTLTKIRLTIIDSYETRRNSQAYKQAYNQNLTIEEVVKKGKAASAIVKDLLSNQNILVITPTKGKIDRYGRVLGAVYLNCVEINSKLLAEHPDLFLKY